MPSLPLLVQRRSILQRSWFYLRRNLNFYRIHVLFFTFTPLIAAAVFWGSNGETRIPFIDALFICVSSMTVTGLATFDLSSATPWQQVIMFILMCMGSPVTVSWLIVYVRRYFFAKKFEHIIESRFPSRGTTIQTEPVIYSESKWSDRLSPWRILKVKRTSRTDSSQLQASDGEKRPANGNRVRIDMIRRVDGAPRLVDPSGWVDNDRKEPGASDSTLRGRQERVRSIPIAEVESPSGLYEDDAVRPSLEHDPASDPTPIAATDDVWRTRHLHRTSSFDAGRRPRPHLSVLNLAGSGAEHDRPFTAHPTSVRDREKHFSRTQTVEFVPPDPEQAHIHGRSFGVHARKVSRASITETSPSAVHRNKGSIRELEGPMSRDPSIRRGSLAHEHLYSDNEWRKALPARTATMQSNRSSIRPPKLSAKEEDFGGFPLPHIWIARLLRRFFPNMQQRLTRTVTMPYTTTVQSQHGGQTTVLGGKPVPYISFDAIVGRNSAFRALTRENLEELGGVEYRALNMLLWIVGLYHVGVPLFAFIIIAPYISQPRWKDVFHPPQQHRFVPPVWYSLFQVISAYTNTGTSLVDQSMIPFQKAYPEVLTLPFVILAGNTAFPVFLRFVIWLSSKTVNKSSRKHETLHFLLDHPRRCFIYLFPSHQTWFLLGVLFILNFTDWFFFLVLDIGNPAIDSIPLGTRFAIGLLQATAVRAAGFGTIALSALAPAVKVLYVVMMYVSVYPIAMSVRSTNVYEERSLGVFEDDSDDEDEGARRHESDESRARIWGKYLAAHARKQLSFDMWVLAVALFFVCIVEKKNLQDDSSASWFNIFNIVFELTSAYGTIGLSLGTPSANYSFSGALQPLSKLIICAVMLRGRHRGLPVAIDRAVLLPAEFKQGDEDPAEETNSIARRASRLGGEPTGGDYEKSFRKEGEVGDQERVRENGGAGEYEDMGMVMDQEDEGKQ